MSDLITEAEKTTKRGDDFAVFANDLADIGLFNFELESKLVVVRLFGNFNLVRVGDDLRDEIMEEVFHGCELRIMNYGLEAKSLRRPSESWAP